MSDVRAIDELFGELIELDSPQQRQEFLGRVGRDDEALRDQLEKLLAAHARAGSFLRDEDDVDATVDAGTDNLVGETIGPYTLREQIGDGGMGVVYVAERRKPYRQKVALKLIKPGMDSQAVLARFDAERQALALMDHPNIARVLDAGTTDRGRPFFVMELIQGQTIAEYCDEKKLTIKQRLELFMRVCQAVQHAHQKGIIHRDIKPNNVLVTEIDGQAEPKVIDFGVAKALSTSLTDRTVYTSFQALVGTPIYMSPEQAKLSGVDVDTRSDVYSLGVLLFELLTGDVPFDRERLKAAALDELCRIIREEDPPTPSVRVSRLGDTATQISQNRGTEPAKLAKALKNELSWIVGKAMDKDRNQRYQTPSELAEDVSRHLSDEPITAGKPSPWARSRRYARRHWKVLAVAIAFLCVGIVSTWQAYRNGQLLAEYRDELISRAVRAAFSGDFLETEKILTRTKEIGGQSEIEDTLLGMAEFYSGKMLDAKGRLDIVVNEHPDDVAAVALLSVVEHLLDHSQRAEELRTKARTMSSRPEFREFDEICLAHANTYDYDFDPNTRIEQMRSLYERGRKPIVALMLAVLLAEKVHHYWDGELSVTDELRDEIKEAELLIEAVRATSPKFYFLNYADLFVLTTKMKILKESGVQTWREDETQGSRMASRMLLNDQSSIGAKLATAFYILTENEKERESAHQTLAVHGIKYPLFCHLHAAGKSVENLAIDQSPFHTDFVTRMAYSTVPLTEEVQRKLKGRHEVDLIFVLLARQQAEDAQRRAIEVFDSRVGSDRTEDSHESELSRHFNEFIEYLAKQHDDDWLLQRAREGEVWLNSTHFLLGLSHYANRDYSSAKKHFESMGSVQSSWIICGPWSRLIMSKIRAMK